MTRIGIIKLGLSETLDDADRGVGGPPSLGDVLRATPLLPALAELYPHNHLTWMTTPQAAPLLAGGPGIDRLITWDGGPEQAPKAQDLGAMDLVINLEKARSICDWADGIPAQKRLGFFRRNGQVACREQDGNRRIMTYLAARRNGGPRQPWQSLLLEMAGASWLGQPYVLGDIATAEPAHDVGLNYAVGGKWPTKAMPQAMWQELAERLNAEGLTISWQRGHNDLRKYLNWIASCHLLVTHDSLGLHAALALGRRVVGLFGPTSAQEIHGYGLATFISANAGCPALPCYAECCAHERHCMEMMDLNQIRRAVLRGLPKGGRAK
ncbi:MAG: glycosyltransferase family 9 protein [Deltaproteobacteria bacterium]|nr:glycosyltransferase family 9 protein [Deltaproteobacteria bacterium]